MFCACRQRLQVSLIARSAYLSVINGTLCCPTRTGNYSTYEGIESSKHMQKLLNKKGAKTKRKWYQAHVAAPEELSGRSQLPNKHGVSQAQGHRARQLSHVLYVKICEIVNSGELDDEILNKQVLITQVKMHPTFKGINVFWDANRADAAEIESLLDVLAGKLRSLLISYHVLGRIPTLTFVKDRSRGDLSRLNQLFDVADYGPDYFPSTGEVERPHIVLGNDISKQSLRLEVDKSLAQDLNELSLKTGHHQTLQTSGNNIGNLKPLPEESLDTPSQVKTGTDQPSELSSSFRSNLYNLPRDDLIKKIVAKKKKVKYQPTSEDQVDDNSSTDSQLRDYRKLRTLAMKDKERMLRQADSTKEKQRLLQAEFDEVQDSLYECDDLTDDDLVNEEREDI